MGLSIALWNRPHLAFSPCLQSAEISAALEVTLPDRRGFSWSLLKSLVELLLLYQSRMTTLPKCAPLSMYRNASRVSSNGNTRSITGWS